MESTEIKKKLESLTNKLEDYEAAIEKIDGLQEEINSLNIALEDAIEAEKHNPWVVNPEVFLGMAFNKDAPRLKIYPVEHVAYGNSNLYKDEYSDRAFDLIGISHRTKQPYKYAFIGNKTGIWCQKFRVRKNDLIEYRIACYDYLYNNVNQGTSKQEGYALRSEPTVTPEEAPNE